LDFVAIDVETANPHMASICQIGLASFSAAGELVDEWVSLVDPEDYFAYPNICVHGIHPADVAGAPTLPDLMEIISSRLRGSVAVCHTHFDRVALGQACRKYGLQPPDCTWLDSARVAQRAWDEFAHSGYGLQNVCARIGYDYQAHDALEDAKAAGYVLIAAAHKTGVSVQDWLAKAQAPIGLYPSGNLSRPSNPDGSLVCEVIVFTGALMISRREAAELAASVGCEVGDGVTKKTTILVVGDQDVARLAGQDKSSKHRKAEALISQGQAIRILCESDFVEVVSTESTSAGS